MGRWRIGDYLEASVGAYRQSFWNPEARRVGLDDLGVHGPQS